MPKLKVLSGKSIIKMLESFGFVLVRIRGSHMRMCHGSYSVTVPFHPELSRKTLLEIYRQANVVIPEERLDEFFYTK